MLTGGQLVNAPPRMLVVVPLVVLTGVFLIVVVAIVMGEEVAHMKSVPMLAGASALYAATVALLYRMGISSITQLAQLSLTDTLCHLPNRRALHADVKSRQASGQQVALALLDLDGFKVVNDLYGHPVGDRMIQHVARRIDDSIGPEAFAYRLGGDEFAIYTSGEDCRERIDEVAAALIDCFAEPIAMDERRIPVGVSIGIAADSRTESSDSSELLRRADLAMYASKRSGKMRSTWYSPEFDRQMVAMRDMDESLRHALENNELTVHYQPIVDALDQQIVGVEALVRWTRPDGSETSPASFIPIAEESGLINAIGAYVLRQACHDARDWAGIKLSVNISAAQLRDPEFTGKVEHILGDTGFEPSRLELEVTETSLVLDPAVAERCFKALRSFGVRIALDDFGTGYASIGFLRQFRFHKLKIDRALVVESAGDEGSRALMLSSITMARALGMDVTAEGVETQEQADLARSAGCDLIQGWLYHKSMPPTEFTTLLNSAGKASDSKTG